ncbi:hypothetical protein [Nocardia gipuzkoensis]|uniref:hypothetical protein n=1 Tax=Nocardia gipuzkoensis TaxID=2749991 RepID=UPI0015EEC725|nr:hypothetical protein [Nocardia gipuzkoensis]
MPRFTASRTAARPGLYRWVGEQLEAAYAVPDPRVVFRADEGLLVAEGPRPVPEQLARFRECLPVTVPAWWLDGHSAYGAGFAGVVTADRKRRASVYVVTPSDTVTAAPAP